MHFSKYRLQNLFVWGIGLTEIPMQRQHELQNSLRSKGVMLRFGLWRLVLDCWKSTAFYFALALDGAKGLNKKWKSNGRAPECGNPQQNPRKTRGKGLQRQSTLLKSLHSLGFVIEKKTGSDSEDNGLSALRKGQWHVLRRGEVWTATDALGSSARQA